MFVSFGMAAESNGDCYLRFDDTNPEAEKLEYIEHIQDIVSWMGWKPYKVWPYSGPCQDILRTRLAAGVHASAEPAAGIGGCIRTSEIATRQASL